MSNASQLPARRRRHASKFGLVIESWRALGSRHASAALALALVNALFASGITLTRSFGMAEYLPAFALRCAFSGIGLMLALTAAECLVDHGAPRLRTFGFAAAAAAIGASVISWYVVALFGWPNWFPAETHMATQRTQMVFEAINGLIYNGLGTAAYLHWRDTQAATVVLHSSELRRAADAQHLQQTRLLALQAHVDPELLFAALKRVSVLQGYDAPCADALLSEVIALLRALMPADHAAASNVAREFAIATSYLRVVASAVAELTIEVSISSQAENARLAPMLLLPLFKAAMVARQGSKPQWQLQAETAPSRLLITLSTPSDAGDSWSVDSSGLEQLRDRLVELHAASATLTVVTSPGFRATLTLPLQYDDRTDR